MAYQFWPQRSSLAAVAKVFILAPPHDQMWHCWKDSGSQCSNVRSHSVVVKVLCLWCQLLRPLQQIHHAVGVGGSHVCLLLPSARLFVCPVLSVSTLALHFCVGVESDPHLPGLFFSSRSLLFLFPLGLRNLNLRQNIHAPSSSAGGHSQGGGSGKRSRDSGMTSTLFFLTAISLEDKWNHMLAAVLGRKMEQGEKKREALA